MSNWSHQEIILTAKFWQIGIWAFDPIGSLKCDILLDDSQEYVVRD